MCTVQCEWARSSVHKPGNTWTGPVVSNQYIVFYDSVEEKVFFIIEVLPIQFEKYQRENIISKRNYFGKNVFRLAANTVHTTPLTHRTLNWSHKRVRGENTQVFGKMHCRLSLSKHDFFSGGKQSLSILSLDRLYRNTQLVIVMCNIKISSFIFSLVTMQ